MTNIHAEDPFEAEVRAAFRSRLDSIDPLIPAKLRQPEPEVQIVAGPVAARRVRSGRSPSSRGLALAALAAVIVLTAGLVGPAFLLRSTGTATGPPVASADVSGGPSDAAILDAHVVASFGSDQLTAAVMGPDGAAYVLDATDQTVYRVDLQTGAKLAVYRPGLGAGGTSTGRPRLLAAGGQDVLILDDLNSVWRWRPAEGDTSGRGSLAELNIPDSVNWGSGVRALGTFIINSQLGMYNLYVVVPSAGQILRYSPAIDGSSFPTAGRANYLSVSQDLSTVDDMYVDGHIFLVDRGKVTRSSRGQAESWTMASPAKSAAEPNDPYYSHLAADDPSQDQGTLYAYDRNNKQVVAIRKADGANVGTYGASAALDDLHAMFLVTAGDGSESLYWLNGGTLLAAPIRLGGGTPTASPSPTVRSEPSVVASFGTDELGKAVLGPNRASAYVIDTTVNKIYRVDLETGAKVALDLSPDDPSASPIGRPRLLGSLNYLLIVDSNNRFWIGPTGNGDKAGSLSVSQLTFDVPPSFSWGTGVRSVCVVSGHPADDSEAGAFDYYVASPTGVEMIKYAPWTPGQTASLHMTHGFDVNQQSAPIDDMYVYSQAVDPLRSGIFLVQGGKISLYENGKPAPQWTFSRPISSSEQAPYYTLLAGDDMGTLFAYDRANKQVAIFSGADGSYVRAALSSPALNGLSSMFVTTGMDQARMLYWITGGKLMSALISGGSGAGP
jgi:hypothetical protein